MKNNSSIRKRFAAKLIAAVLCVCLLPAGFRVRAFGEETKAADIADDPYRLVAFPVFRMRRQMMSSEERSVCISITERGIRTGLRSTRMSQPVRMHMSSALWSIMKKEVPTNT